MKICLYCGGPKPEGEFSDEHIWPDALGGDHLPHDLWRTNDVCRSCNNISGVFVDGAFIRSFLGQSERTYGDLDYLAGAGRPVGISLVYLGPIHNIPAPAGHIADFWVCPHGANIIHIRPDDRDGQWLAYAGGDPRAKKSNAGRAYMMLTSEHPFWIKVSLVSFRRHFGRAKRFITNMDIPDDWPFRSPDPTDPIEAEDMKMVQAFIDGGSRARGTVMIRIDTGNRMLAKLALGVGYKLFGSPYLQTEYALHLRRAMREADFQKRQSIPIRGTGHADGSALGDAAKLLAWPGGWVLMITIAQENIGLFVITPSGKSMGIMISDDQELIARLQDRYAEGVVWITVPAAAKAVGPLQLPDYLAHQTRDQIRPTLADLEAGRGDPADLPPCRGARNHE